MNAPQSFERVILKVLNGVQAGAEVSLVPGEYTVGTGSEDDIQLIDVSIKAGQARIRISAGQIELAGGTGAVNVGSGETISANSDFHEIEPLEVIELGMVRFVLGPPNANWNTLTEKPEAVEKSKSSQKKKPAAGIFGRQGPRVPAGERRFGQITLPVLLLLAMVGAGVWYFSDVERSTLGSRLTLAEAEKTVRASLDQFPFGKSIALRSEPDGTLYATGFVKDNFERRALVQAIEREGVQVYFRLGVIDALQNEMEGLIRSENLPVTFTISPEGVLTLEGVILDDKIATQFVNRIKEGVVGFSEVNSEIRTANSMLSDVQKLSGMAEIDSYVLLRLDGKVIEASGILPINRIDGWVGFLQSYVRRFAKDIGLRSFVQLQAADGSLISAGGKLRPVVINGDSISEDDIVLDAQRIAQGQYDPSEVFARSDQPNSEADGTTQTAAAAQAAQARAQSQLRPLVPISASTSLNPSASDLPPPSKRTAFEAEQMALVSNDLIARWKAGKTTAAEDKDIAMLARARAELAFANGDTQYSENIAEAFNNGMDKEKIAENFFPLFAGDAPSFVADACRPGSRLTPKNIPVALFWLDLLSVSETFSLTTFKRDEQAFMLEAALDPTIVNKCLTDSGAKPSTTSVYLNETARNPEFVRFLTRQFEVYPMDVSGASLVNEARYIQMRNGQKVGEGAAPDSASRLVIVGELGSAVQRKEGFWAVIYNPSLNWLSQE